ncbi:MAG: hypothetical protein KDA29_15040 [Phycisphaerales bacterium]|nr:hypothetical protein [Phycisphaerales bacterium]
MTIEEQATILGMIVRSRHGITAAECSARTSMPLDQIEEGFYALMSLGMVDATMVLVCKARRANHLE